MGTGVAVHGGWRLFSIICLTFLSACSTTNHLYDWGTYEQDLYRYYKKAATRPAALDNLLVLINRLESRNVRVAPGLYAELGTFYLEAGDPNRALKYYQKERDTWPESQKLMGALIKNISEMTVEKNDTFDSTEVSK